MPQARIPSCYDVPERRSQQCAVHPPERRNAFARTAIVPHHMTALHGTPEGTQANNPNVLWTAKQARSAGTPHRRELDGSECLQVTSSCCITPAISGRVKRGPAHVGCANIMALLYSEVSTTAKCNIQGAAIKIRSHSRQILCLNVKLRQLLVAQFFKFLRAIFGVTFKCFTLAHPYYHRATIIYDLGVLSNVGTTKNIECRCV